MMKSKYKIIATTIPILISFAVCSCAHGKDLNVSIGSSYWNDRPELGDWREEYYHGWSISGKISAFYPINQDLHGGFGFSYNRWFVDKPTNVPATIEPKDGRKNLYEILVAARYYIVDTEDEGPAVLFVQFGTSLFIEDSFIIMEHFDEDRNSESTEDHYHQDAVMGVHFGLGGGCTISDRISLIFSSRIHHLYGEDYPQSILTFDLGLMIGMD